MGKQFKELSPRYIDFIEQQKVFFVGSAAETGKVNISPKGGDSLRVLSSTQVAWLNLTGSGNETAAHIQKLPRMTIMFCAFEGAPIILRLYGSARVIHKADSDWDSYIDMFPASEAARQVFLLDVELVQSSCGMSVPLFDYEKDRDELTKWSDKQGQDSIESYWINKNQRSLDDFETNIVELSGLEK